MCSAPNATIINAVAHVRRREQRDGADEHERRAHDRHAAHRIGAGAHDRRAVEQHPDAREIVVVARAR